MPNVVDLPLFWAVGPSRGSMLSDGNVGLKWLRVTEVEKYIGKIEVVVRIIISTAGPALIFVR